MCSGKVFENRDQIKELIIVSVRKPAANGYRVLGVENVGCRRVVNDDCLSNVTPNLGKILYTCQQLNSVRRGEQITNLDIVSLVVIATVPE